MSNVTDALLHALDIAGIEVHSPCLLILPDDQALSVRFPKAAVWHPQSDQAAAWAARSHRVLSELAPDEEFRTIIISCPKQKEETQYLMAQAVSLLSPGGVLVAAADNLAGGKALSKLLGMISDVSGEIAKHKCRVVWTDGAQKRRDGIVKALSAGSEQARGDGFVSQPGLFSWSRLDRGTNVLLHHLPFSLAGIGADFGCGIGVLGARLLQRHADITRLYCIDNDSRAVMCARKNLERWSARCDFMWADVRRLPQLPPLDFVVMNPPFHQGKMDANILGQNFIASAAAHLKPGGMMTFVANTHLPYEAVVHQHFSMQRQVGAQDGFKVIEAVK